jgi:hypothetical protein
MDGTILAFATELHRMEGVTVVEDETTINADFTDGDGNTIGFVDGSPATLTRFAYWMHPQWPHARVTKNVATVLPASTRQDSYQICPMPAGTFKTVWRAYLGTSLEALGVTSLGARSPAGRATRVQRSLSGTPAPATDPVAGTGVTDASGYVVVGVRNGTVAGSDIYLYFAP